MALFAGGKHFCKVFWMEPGNTVVRRIFQITIQQPSGLVDHYEGKSLPNSVVIQSGPSNGGKKASMQVLMQPEGRMAERNSVRFPVEYHWPRRRDLIHMGAGFFLLGLIRLFLIVAELSQ